MLDTAAYRRWSVSVVMLTHNRRAQALHTVARLVDLPEQPPIVVVDNASTDDTGAAIRRRFPWVHVIRLRKNIGAAGRNYGVAAVRTPYVAFCDDDTWWAPGSLARAQSLLDRWPTVAVLCARVLVGPTGRFDPACDGMARSPLDSEGLPGKAILGFRAGASVMRVRAFQDVGGYSRRLFIGGEEQLVALDLATHRWKIVYCDALTVHHWPAQPRDPQSRASLVARNGIWVAWLRLPWREAARISIENLCGADLRGVRTRTLWQVLSGMPWALAARSRVPKEVQAMRRMLESAPRALVIEHREPHVTARVSEARHL